MKLVHSFTIKSPVGGMYNVTLAVYVFAGR